MPTSRHTQLALFDTAPHARRLVHVPGWARWEAAWAKHSPARPGVPTRRRRTR